MRHSYSGSSFPLRGIYKGELHKPVKSNSVVNNEALLQLVWFAVEMYALVCLASKCSSEGELEQHIRGRCKRIRLPLRPRTIFGSTIHIKIFELSNYRWA